MSILSVASSIASSLLNGQTPAVSQAVSGANKAFSALLQQASSAAPVAQKDLSALGNALSTGNLSQAQTAFSQLIQDVGSATAHQLANYKSGPSQRLGGMSMLG
jgi:hypothetical protein